EIGVINLTLRGPGARERKFGAVSDSPAQARVTRVEPVRDRDQFRHSWWGCRRSAFLLKTIPMEALERTVDRSKIARSRKLLIGPGCPGLAIEQHAVPGVAKLGGRRRNPICVGVAGHLEQRARYCVRNSGRDWAASLPAFGIGPGKIAVRANHPG